MSAHLSFRPARRGRAGRKEKWKGAAGSASSFQSSVPPAQGRAGTLRTVSAAPLNRIQRIFSSTRSAHLFQAGFRDAYGVKHLEFFDLARGRSDRSPRAKAPSRILS